MIKDYVTRLSVVFLGALFIIYIVSLRSSDVLIVNQDFASYNTMMYVLITALTWYVATAYWLYPLDLPRLKRTLFAIGLTMLFVWHYVLQDNPQNNVFFADLTKVIGVVLIIVAPFGLLVSDRIKKKRKASKIEVIEV